MFGRSHSQVIDGPIFMSQDDKIWLKVTRARTRESERPRPGCCVAIETNLTNGHISVTIVIVVVAVTAGT